jgi:putative ABC transport system permease protein
MTRFLFKGLIRDPNRSVFPILITAAGAMITVFMFCWVKGAVGDITGASARLETGHVKIMTRAYAALASQAPNDLALLKVNTLIRDLKQGFPDMEWAPRIRFGGLLDFPDDQGETRDQGPVTGMALDLFSPDAGEVQRLNLDQALVKGRLPRLPGEILISDEFARSLHVSPGDTATLISTSANGGMVIFNFKVAGTLRFGIQAMDKGALLADLSDLQYALDMEDGAGEVLGFFPNMMFDPGRAERMAREFNGRHGADPPESAPRMFSLKDQAGLGPYLDLVDFYLFVYLAGFVFVMSLVLWNTGLMSGLRRYGEIGVRLAIGESKGHVYGSLIGEALITGLIGSAAGTGLGLWAAYYLQEHGFDISFMIQGSTLFISNVIRAKITSPAFFVGYVPGLLATTLGALVSGLGIFKRETAELFKELHS